MFILKKTITPFVLPPGIIIVAIFIISFLLLFRKKTTLGLANLAIGIALWGLSTAPVANSLMQGLEGEYAFPGDYSGDVIVLLGGGILDRVPDLTGTAAPTPLMMGRIVTAVRLHKQLGIPIIVSGGKGAAMNSTAEAPVAKRFLVDLGVPEASVMLEDKARDTAENAFYSTALCRNHGFNKPILLTAAHHLKRSHMAFEAAGLDVTPVPAYFSSSKEPIYTWRNLLPSAGTLFTTVQALHEYFGLVYYRFAS